MRKRTRADGYRNGERVRNAILEFIKSYSGQRGYPPTEREIAEAVNITAMPAHYHVLKLVEAGRLSKAPGHRSLVVIE